MCESGHTYPSEPGQVVPSSILFVGRVLVRPAEQYTRLFVCPVTGRMFEALVKVQGNVIINTDPSPISPLNMALFEAAKKELADSIDAARRFGLSMISLSVALIAAYLPLVKFVGIDWKAASILPKIAYALPPFSFWGSCILFILACFPRTYEFSLEIPDEIKEARDKIIKERRTWIRWATVLLLLGIFVAIIAIGLNISPNSSG